MNKILLSVIFSLTVIISNSQIIVLNEDFEGSSGLPQGWTEITTSTFPRWSFSEVGNTHYLVIPYHSKIAYLNEGDVDKELPGESLITPSINLSGISSAYLSFDVFFKAMTYQSITESFSIEVSVDGGSSWSAIMNTDAYFNWHKVYCDLSDYCGNQNVQIAFKYSDAGGWLYGVGIDNVKVQIPYTNDAALQSLNKYNFVLINDTIRFSGLLQNLGTDNLESFNVNWRINGGNTFSHNYSSMGLNHLDTFNFIHPTPWIPVIQEATEIEIWISNPNGIPDENPSNDSLSFHITNVVSSKPDKKVFLEVFGATWCTICPHAANILSEINSSTENLITAVIHVDDPYSCNIGTEIFENYHLFPGWLVTGLIDRYNFSKEVSMDMDRTLWPHHVYQREEDISPVDLSVNNNFNPETRELEINLAAIFRCNMMGDFRFNCYLVEDSITSEQDNVLNIPDRDPYCHKDYWVYNPPGTIENYIHMNVLRDVLGGPWGSAGSLPNYVVDGNSYEFQYNYLVPEEFESSKLRIIGIIQKFNSDSSKCEVYNALDMHLDYFSSINVQDSSSSSIHVYPNPAHSIIYFNNIDPTATISVFTMQGKMVLNKQVTNNQIDISNLSNGVYILKVMGMTRVKFCKFVKQ